MKLETIVVIEVPKKDDIVKATITVKSHHGHLRLCVFLFAGVRKKFGNAE